MPRRFIMVSNQIKSFFLQHAIIIFTFSQQCIFVTPLELKAIETDHVFQVRKYHSQTVQLISQPEICKAHFMEGSSEHPELEKEKESTTTSLCKSRCISTTLLKQSIIQFTQCSLVSYLLKISEV